MYNFTVPSMLKAWIDHVARAGVTFAYTEQGPKGLLTGKKVYLVATMGGVHEAGVSDFIRPYMKLVMGFLGLADVEVITASGLNLGQEPKQAGLRSAREQIAGLTAKVAA
jgi:FMN-dependent NADH-azoreductase